MLRLVAKLAKSCHVATYHKVGYCTNLIILTVWSQSLRGSWIPWRIYLFRKAQCSLRPLRLRITSYKMTVHVILSYPSLVPRPAVSGLGTRLVLPERGPPVGRRTPLEYCESTQMAVNISNHCVSKPQNPQV